MSPDFDSDSPAQPPPFAEGFDTRLFPTVVMRQPPPPVHLPDVHHMHVNPKRRRR